MAWWVLGEWVSLELGIGRAPAVLRRLVITERIWEAE